MRGVARFVARMCRKVGITLAGSILLVAGLIMLLTPGPGVLTICAALALLGTEYAWAERAFRKARSRAGQAATQAAGIVRRRTAGDRPPAV